MQNLLTSNSAPTYPNFNHHVAFNKCIKQLSGQTTFLFIDDSLDFGAREVMTLRQNSDFFKRCYDGRRNDFLVNLTNTPIKASEFSILARSIIEKKTPENLTEASSISQLGLPLCITSPTAEAYLINTIQTSPVTAETYKAFYELGDRLETSTSQPLRDAIAQFFCNIFLRPRDYRQVPSKNSATMVKKMRPEVLTMKEPGSFFKYDIFRMTFFWLAQRWCPQVIWHIEVLDEKNDSVDDEDVAILLEKCPQIYSLSIKSEKITSTAIEHCARHFFLQYLHLTSSATISDEATLAISNHPNLVQLTLEGWKGLSEEGIVNLANTNYLKYLHFVETQPVYEYALEKLAASPVAFWNFEGLRLTDDVLLVLSKNTSLQHLFLNKQPQLSITVLSSLADKPLLTLVLDDCTQLNPSTVAKFVNHPSLRSLYLRRCGIESPRLLATELKRPKIFA